MLQNHEKLKFVDVSNSQQLIKMPNLSSMPNLEILNIGGCTSLHKLHSSIGAFSHMKFIKELRLNGTGIKEVPTSIGYLTSLEILDFSWCWKFQKLPDIFANMKRLRMLFMSGTKIKELPRSIGYLESLETISLRDCSKFEKFPEIQVNMKCFCDLEIRNTAIKELPNNIGYLEALTDIIISGCPNLEKIPEIQRNMGSLSSLQISGTDIKELPYSIAHLIGLQYLVLKNCKCLKSLPGSICGLKSLKKFMVDGCSNLDLECYWEIVGHLKDLQNLELRNCENLVTLPNCIGNMTHLQSLRLCYCPKLQKLPDSLRSLQCCLTTLDLSGCNMMEGEIPSDLWCLSSLIYLNVSRNHIRRIPTGIIQLSKLKCLFMNHCPMLEEIPELPSSLGLIQAHNCPFLKVLSPDPTTDILWSSLLNSFKLYIEVLLSEFYFYT